MKNENYIKPCEKQFDSIISKNCNETININLQPERKNSFKQPESPLKSESKNSFLIPSSRKNSDRGNNKQPESPLQVSSDSKNPFLLQNSMLHESLDDFVKKMNDTSSKNTEKINSIKNSNFSYRQEDNNENPFLAKVLLSPQNDLKNHTKSNSDLIPESPIKSLISNPLINTIHNQNSQNNAILNESFINKNNNLTNSSTITTEPINQHINNFNNNSLLNAFPENLTNNQATTKPHSTIPNFLANANQSPSNPQFFSNLLGNNANTNMENAFTPNFTTKSSGGIFGGLLEKTNIFGFNNNASEANHMNDTTGFQSSLFSNFHDPMGSTNSSSNTNLKGNKKRKQRVNN